MERGPFLSFDPAAIQPPNWSEADQTRIRDLVRAHSDRRCLIAIDPAGSGKSHMADAMAMMFGAYSPDTAITDAAIDTPVTTAPYTPDTGEVVVEWMNRRRAPLSLRLFRGAALLAVVAMAIALVLR